MGYRAGVAQSAPDWIGSRTAHPVCILRTVSMKWRKVRPTGFEPVTVRLEGG